MGIEVKAPNRVLWPEGAIKIFLAGSIDMGSAVDWQTRVSQALVDDNVAICNPRRDDWDSSWVQDISNPQFNEQVTWELEHIEQADLILVYFDPYVLAPITLMELGIMSGLDCPVIVCCPEGYWRRGNVQMVCDRYCMVLVDTIEDLIDNATLIIDGMIISGV